MINCHNGALPQAGLQDAYVVYELMVEGGITRMMALFKDIDSDKIGSIRSARMQYLDYALENNAIYIHAGGAPDALGLIFLPLALMILMLTVFMVTEILL